MRHRIVDLPKRSLFLAGLLAASIVGAQTSHKSPAIQTRDSSKAGSQSQTSSRGIVLYVASWCGYCRQARAYLARSGIKYEEVDIDTPAGKAAFAAAGSGAVPLLVANGEQLRGFSELAYDFFFARLR